MEPIIEVKKISKEYDITKSIQQPYYTLRDYFSEIFKKPFEYVFSKKISSKRESFWALIDIDFSVMPGEVIGIIGKNGAGKSTLLKILSQITPPTSGSVHLRGRIASLLEIGTGFHPELSGRENIFLNGAILGMTRKEIKSKIDKIIDFSGVGKFIDTPVKRYSSGMYVRLAFAVAAHLEPEILIVDEVLAVGDAEFQKKCLLKMGEVSKQGRTVIFVSHNMQAITSLCSRAIVLEAGRCIFSGKTSEAVLHYLTNGAAYSKQVDYSNKEKRIGDDYATLLSGSIRNLNGDLLSEININEPVKIRMEFEILKETRRKFLPQVHFFTSGVQAFAEYYQCALNLRPGKYQVDFNIPANFLNNLAYSIAFGLTTTDVDSIIHFYEPDALIFNVRDPIENTPGPRQAGYTGEIPGLIRPQFDWTMKEINK
jgi:lipopolysaccharide transport system ATP-binding protein